MKTKSTKRSDRTVAFEEMQRLMNIYGSIKCLRKRQSTSSKETVKIETIKRKFYRWFPDLEERFERDEGGIYRPRFGHEFEMCYREEMRAKDGVILGKKRTSSRKKRIGNGKRKSEGTKIKAVSPSSSFANYMRGSPMVSAVVSPVVFTSGSLSVTSPLQRIRSDVKGISITPQYDDEPMRSISDSITTDAEPVDSCFIAQKGIFDDVEKNFFSDVEDECHKFVENNLLGSSTLRDCPNLQQSCLSSSSEADEESQSDEDMLDESIEECFKEMLGSDDDHSVDDYLFDMIST